MASDPFCVSLTTAKHVPTQAQHLESCARMPRSTEFPEGK